MASWFSMRSRAAATGALLMGCALAASPLSHAGTEPHEPTPAESAIMYRQALYTVLDGSFEPLGRVMKGRAPFRSAEVVKHAERLAFLATMIGDAFPEISKSGNTSAKPEIWTQRAEFERKITALVTNTAALVAELKLDSSNSAAFRKAVGAVGQACKSCHDDFKKD